MKRGTQIAKPVKSAKSERSTTVKKQSGINGLLPALRAGPFHLFRLLLDLRFDVLKKVTVTFPSEKVFFHRRPSGPHALRVTQSPPDTATHWLNLSEPGWLNFCERRR
jgi:hypothetical protein